MSRLPLGGGRWMRVVAGQKAGLLNIYLFAVQSAECLDGWGGNALCLDGWVGRVKKLDSSDAERRLFRCSHAVWLRQAAPALLM